MGSEERLRWRALLPEKFSRARRALGGGETDDETVDATKAARGIPQYSILPRAQNRGSSEFWKGAALATWRKWFPRGVGRKGKKKLTMLARSPPGSVQSR